MGIFSKEMKNELFILIDERLKELKIVKNITSIESSLEEVQKNFSYMSSEVEDNNDIIKELGDKIETAVLKDDLKTTVGETMLKLMPTFKDVISKEIKEHLVAIAEFVIEKFKIKE